MEAQRISAQTIKQRMKKGDYFVFIDTRNPQAWESSDIKLPHARRIPAEEIEQRLDEIPTGLPIITYCT
jgi:rhodanese-related sulfurtransferase